MKLGEGLPDETNKRVSIVAVPTSRCWARLIGRVRLHRPDIERPTDSERNVPAHKEVITDGTVNPLPDIPLDPSDA